jgi:hypothetical protein
MPCYSSEAYSKMNAGMHCLQQNSLEEKGDTFILVKNLLVTELASLLARNPGSGQFEEKKESSLHNIYCPSYLDG